VLAEAAGKLFVTIIRQTIQDEGAKQDFAPGVSGPFLFGEPGLQRLLLRFELSEPLFDRLSCHSAPPSDVSCLVDVNASR
jgi:hypothetical protein